MGNNRQTMSLYNRKRSKPICIENDLSYTIIEGALFVWSLKRAIVKKNKASISREYCETQWQNQQYN